MLCQWHSLHADPWLYRSFASFSLMPPLTRQRTPQSLHSEWSRTSLGVTMSIHAVAKPLMKVMYHRAVMNLIKRQRGIPLSAETMELYESYLGWKYVAETTKTIILYEIGLRARVAVAEAEVAASFLLSYESLLESTNDAIQRWTAWTLGQLASHSLTRRAVITVQPCARLVALLRYGSEDVVEGVCYALAQISYDLDGAKSIVEAGVLNFIPELLESATVAVRRWASWIFAELAFHPSTQGAVVAIQPCPRLVALLG
ncbi:hypothetical protein C8F04DRAFT_685855 [Mycena alexandri]|uniref:Uncharacterized protein n=1 Tax=Mycena alexandri TaxID=1745969 RepID=A0AAD6TER4_9AGAR|nr:hypothetical protein C8F04DRAFT_685855 [Mycena alexandri]